MIPNYKKVSIYGLYRNRHAAGSCRKSQSVQLERMPQVFFSSNILHAFALSKAQKMGCRPTVFQSVQHPFFVIYEIFDTHLLKSCICACTIRLRSLV